MRWQLTVSDTGPGLHSESGKPLTEALHADAAPVPAPAPSSPGAANIPASLEAGEGIGLSIVKRLCDLLDASIDVKSVRGVGTTFRILFPRRYHQPP
jgi:sensor histidine kinase YesM